jgi:hypothetical protein
MDTEQRVQLAIQAIQSHAELSVRSAAKTFDVPRTTLWHRIAGMLANKDSKQHIQRLTPEEEASIRRVILQIYL